MALLVSLVSSVADLVGTSHIFCKSHMQLSSVWFSVHYWPKDAFSAAMRFEIFCFISPRRAFGVTTLSFLNISPSCPDRGMRAGLVHWSKAGPVLVPYFFRPANLWRSPICSVSSFSVSICISCSRWSEIDSVGGPHLAGISWLMTYDMLKPRKSQTFWEVYNGRMA